jgi:hypothetical protein
LIIPKYLFLTVIFMASVLRFWRQVLRPPNGGAACIAMEILS